MVGPVVGRRCTNSDSSGRLAALPLVLMVVLTTVPLTALVAAPVYAINLTHPDGGEVLITGQPYRVKWLASDTGGFIHVGLSTDGGASFTPVASLANTGGLYTGYNWRVPYIDDCSTCRIKVVWTETDSPKSAVFAEDESADNFTISRDHWLAFRDVPDVMTHGKYQPVPWELLDPDGEVGALDLEYSVDEGSGWSAWTSAGIRFTGMEPTLSVVYWTPPNYNRTQGRLRLVARDAPGGAVLRTAESTEFQIRSAILTLVAPNGGEALVQGGTFTVEWRVVEDPGELINGFGLFYSLDGGSTWHTISMSLPPSFTYVWSVPPGGTSDRVRLRVEAYYLEFSVLDRDESDADCRIMASASSMSVTLLDPNPPATGNYMEERSYHTIAWSTTGGSSSITEFRLSFSDDGGATWSDITTVGPTVRDYSWNVPLGDTLHGRVRVVMVTTSTSYTAMSNNDFIIYRRGAFNTPPVAEAGSDRTMWSGASLRLDGRGSFDREGDPLTYNWMVLNDYGFNVTLSRANTAEPTLVAYIGDYNLTIVVELRVDDGGTYDPAWPFYTDRVSVFVEAGMPSITSFHPQYGWAGTNLTVEGSFTAGSVLHLDGEAMYTVPSSHAAGDPVTFRLREGLPFGSYPIEVRNTRGSSTTSDELEVHPAPVWPNGWGLQDHNPTDDILTYPWLLWEEGSYKDTFGEDQVYTPFYVCIGLPWYDPWTGYSCLGYEFEESLFPDPLASLYYGCFYCWIARYGECFGMSATALQLYHNDAMPSRWNDSALYANQLSLADDPEFNRNVDKMQGSQLSAEILEWYILRFLEGLEPSAEFPMPPLGMGLFLNRVESALTSHEMGIITMVAGGVAHAVVPWKVVNIPYDDTVRIYVYDCNKEWWSTEQGTWEAFNDTRDIVHTPPYIEVVKTGGWWEWSYDFSDTVSVSSTTGIAFVPYDVVNGPRTLPTDWDSMSMFLVGDATSTVEDGEGNLNGWHADGSPEVGIPGSAPAPPLMGLGDHAEGWLVANGTDLTTTLRGMPGGGVYNWSVFWNGTSAFALTGAGVGASSIDTISMEYPGGNPLRGRLTYSTTDASKGYSFTHIKAMGAEGWDPKARQRVYSLDGATLRSGSQAVINTTDDYQSLVFENRGPAPITLSVGFQTNVISEAALNDSGGLDHLPTARLENVEVGPYEVVTFTPSNWLDLDHADITVHRVVPDALPPGQVATFMAESRLGQGRLAWTPPEDDGGAPVTDYVIWRGPLYNDLNQLAIVDDGDRLYIDDTVELGKTYFYAIQAANRVGPGKMSPSVGIWIQQGPARPSAPVGLEASVVAGQVMLAWSPPEDDGGGTISGYRLFREEVDWASSPTLLVEVGAVGKHTDDTVEANTTYYYWIAAVNEAGEGMVTGPVPVTVPPDGGNGGGGGNGDDGGGGLPLGELAMGATILVVAVGVGVFLGRRFSRKGF